MPESTLTRSKFHLLQTEARDLLNAQKLKVLVCAGTGCVANGSMKVYDTLKAACGMRAHTLREGG